ncbi:hypothetical protein F0562_023417 [Nyssa sinensis]|uniref:Uncharacterized protein n=1 Tax=Nyssa sinensis TaxID=561372 RepID=A0A5J5BKV5_9ASTE|nr:hypothetical protein F0562_023417 [Nyssa sinensis]
MISKGLRSYAYEQRMAESEYMKYKDLAPSIICSSNGGSKRSEPKSINNERPTPRSVAGPRRYPTAKPSSPLSSPGMTSTAAGITGRPNDN